MLYPLAVCALIFVGRPVTLRCLMAYIVDLTLVLEHLFWIALAAGASVQVQQQWLQLATEEFRTSQHRAQVHTQIRAYVDETSFARHLEPSHAQDEVARLIRAHRVERGAGS